MDLQESIRDLVLAVDGVDRLYPVDPAWRRFAKETLALALNQAPNAAVVDVDTSHAKPSVKLRVGATGAVPAPALARELAAVVREHLRDAFPGQDAKVAVEICAIAAGGTG